MIIYKKHFQIKKVDKIEKFRSFDRGHMIYRENPECLSVLNSKTKKKYSEIEVGREVRKRINEI